MISLFIFFVHFCTFLFEQIDKEFSCWTFGNISFRIENNQILMHFYARENTISRKMRKFYDPLGIYLGLNLGSLCYRVKNSLDLKNQRGMYNAEMGKF